MAEGLAVKADIILPSKLSTPDDIAGCLNNLTTAVSSIEESVSKLEGLYLSWILS